MAASTRNRAFKQALLASLALHAALLATFPDLRPAMTQAVESVPIIARLLDLPVAPPPPAPEPQPAPKKKAARVEPVVRPKPEPTPAPLALPAPTAQSVPVAPEPPAPTVTSEPVAAPPQPAPPAPQATASAASAPAVEARSADQYRLELIATANRIKDRMRYPPQAKENSWEGDVLLGVVVSASGRASITIKRSSQYEVLDRQAVEILRLAAREVAVPPAMQGRESTLKDLSFEYRLKD